MAPAAILSAAVVAKPQSDWRKSGTAEAKIQNLVDVLPSAANIMSEMGERYQNLY